MTHNYKIDTIVCPSSEENAQLIFVKDKCWYPVRMDSRKIPKMHYIAIYEKKPISAIRYIGKIKKISPYQNLSKFIIELDGNPIKIDPIRLEPNQKNAPQSVKYTSKHRIDSAKSLSELFN